MMASADNGGDTGCQGSRHNPMRVQLSACNTGFLSLSRRYEAHTAQASDDDSTPV